MQKFILVTEDGSHTIAIPELGVTYHSKHGAIAESMHVFIEAGLVYCVEQNKLPSIRIFEMGFGTGLNALLSYQFATTNAIPINYTGIDLHPLMAEEYEALNYDTQLNAADIFLKLHTCSWNREHILSPYFSIVKMQQSLLGFSSTEKFDLIYFDAFSPTDQPELWTGAVFGNLIALLNPNGILVTYCSKSIVRKAMQEAGFSVEKIPGPLGKREMVRAKKMFD